MRGEEAARGCVPASGETSSAVPFPKEGFYAPIANKNPTCNWFSCSLFSRLKSLPVRKLFCYRWQHWGCSDPVLPGFEAAHNTLQPQPATAPPKLPCCGIASLIPNCFKFCHQHCSLLQTAGEHSDPKQNKSPTVLQSHWLLQLTLRQLTAGI